MIPTMLFAMALAVEPLPIAGQASRFRPLPSEDRTPTPQKTKAAGSRRTLPFSDGRQFATLDAYLAYRREGGAIDLPWYEEVEPDVFVLRTSMRPQGASRRVTRAELAREFGFDR